MCATTRMVGAAEALQVGLATLVCPVTELDAALADLVAAVTAPMAGAVRETKALLQSASGRTLDEQRACEREAQLRRFRDLAALMA
jgi:enoyl-CoA hydratase/carnithine racemase